jgi:hypothetical protein
MALLDVKPNDPRVPALGGPSRARRVARDGPGGTRTRPRSRSSPWVSSSAGRPLRGAYSGGSTPARLLIGSLRGRRRVLFKDLPEGAPITRADGPRLPQRRGASSRCASAGIPADDGAFRPESEGLEVEREFLTAYGTRAGPAARCAGTARRRAARGCAARWEASRTSSCSNLLPAGLEVENPRLESSESLPVDRGTRAGHGAPRHARRLAFWSSSTSRTRSGTRATPCCAR